MESKQILILNKTKTKLRSPDCIFHLQQRGDTHTSTSDNYLKIFFIGKHFLWSTKSYGCQTYDNLEANTSIFGILFETKQNSKAYVTLQIIFVAFGIGLRCTIFKVKILSVASSVAYVRLSRGKLLSGQAAVQPI